MASRDAREPQARQPARGLHAPVLALLARRIAAGRADMSVQRDPDFIRRQLPAIARYTSYFTPEVRGLDRLPAEGPALLVGNHSCLFYMPEVWTCGQAVLSRRGIDAPAYALALRSPVRPAGRRAVPAPARRHPGQLQGGRVRAGARGMCPGVPRRGPGGLPPVDPAEQG